MPPPVSRMTTTDATAFSSARTVIVPSCICSEQFFRMLPRASAVHAGSQRTFPEASTCICWPRSSMPMANGSAARASRAESGMVSGQKRAVPASSFASFSSDSTSQSIRATCRRSARTSPRLSSSTCPARLVSSRFTAVSGVRIWCEISAMASASCSFSFSSCADCSRRRSVILRTSLRSRLTSPSP